MWLIQLQPTKRMFSSSSTCYNCNRGWCVTFCFSLSPSPCRALTLWWPGMVRKTSRRSGCRHNVWVSAGAPLPVCPFACLTRSATHTQSARWGQPRHPVWLHGRSPHATSSLSLFICAIRSYRRLIRFFQHKFPFFEPWTHTQLHVFNFGNVNVKVRFGLYSANRGNAGSSVILNYSIPPALTVFLRYLFTVFRAGCIKLSSVRWDGDICLTCHTIQILGVIFCAWRNSWYPALRMQKLCRCQSRKTKRGETKSRKIT